MTTISNTNLQTIDYNKKTKVIQNVAIAGSLAPVSMIAYQIDNYSSKTNTTTQSTFKTFVKNIANNSRKNISNGLEKIGLEKFSNVYKNLSSKKALATGLSLHFALLFGVISLIRKLKED